MSTSEALILNLSDNLRAGIGPKESLYIFENPKVFDVPTGPAYCRQVLIWRNNVLPVMDLAAWLEGRAAQPDPRLVVVVGYRGHPDESVKYGSLVLTDIPRRTQVSDEQACDLPDEAEQWATLAISCFTHGDTPIPIIDLRYIFSHGPT